jgi:hypothetical protein
MEIFMKDVLYTNVFESALQEVCKPAEAQGNFSEGKDSEGLIKNNFETHITFYTTFSTTSPFQTMQYFICVLVVAKIIGNYVAR